MVNETAPDKEYSLEKDAFYQIAKRIGMDVSIYDSSTANVSKKIAHDLMEKIKHSTDEENESYKDILSKNKRLSKKFENILNKINTGREDMTDINYKEEFEKKDIYKIAKALELDLSAFSIDSQDSLDKALVEIKDMVKKKQQENSDEENKKAMDRLETQELKDEFQNIQKEDEPASKTTRDTLTIEDKEADKDKPLELSWVDQKKQFWAQYAADNALTPDFENPEEDKSPVYCKLSKDENVSGVVSYSAANAAQISKDSELKIYQGLVKDAVQSNLSITFGESLGDAQKLMLYAAVLSSTDKYKNGDAVEAVNPPALTEELMKSEAFTNLPDEAKSILQAEFDRNQKEVIAQKLKDLRSRVVKKELSPEERYALRKEQAELMHHALSPEELAKRQEKEVAREKIMAARLGIIPELKLTTEKGSERVVTKDDTLFDKDGNLNESRISKETFEHLLKYKEGKGK